MTACSIKSHEEHQTLISANVSEIHAELDKILKVVVEDRSYGARKDHSGTGHAVDLPHVRRLFDGLFESMSVLQTEAHEIAVKRAMKKLNKALKDSPCGFLNVEEVSSVAIRLLRINSTSSPKQVRADKKLYDDLILVHLPDLHALAWKLVGFLLQNVEMGTEVFERELGILARDQLKSDLKAFESSGAAASGKLIEKGSERALELFCHLTKSSASFNGQVFVNEFVQSGVLVDLSLKASRAFVGLLRRGLTSNDAIGNSNKKARYHQVAESDQKRLENAQSVFSGELKEIFSVLCRSFTVFESSQSHLTPQDHVQVTENILLSIATLFQSQHNYKFVLEVSEGEYLRQLVQMLSGALVSFQPAYLPPFLPLAMRLLSLMAGRGDGAGLAARKALLQVDLMIHPRRMGPIVYRQASESVIKVFERPEPISEIVVESESRETVEVVETVETVVPVSAVKESTIQEPAIKTVPEPVVIPSKTIESLSTPVTVPTAPVAPATTTAPVVSKPIVTPIASKPVSSTTPSVPAQKRPLENDSDDDGDDDLPLPQIVDSGPDDN